MPQSFDILTESPASVEQIHAAFGHEDYWLARVADSAVTTTLDSLDVNADGAVTVHITQHLGRQLIPGAVAKFVPGELKIMHTERWKPDGEGQVRGHINFSASGGLGSGHAKNWLAPGGSGSQLRSALRVQVKIPLVGAQLEKSIGTNLAESIPGLLDFTTTWIAEHA